jgi:cyclopropane fatty-acyl-phospholipid synthase-like methyltransferase
MIEYLKTKKGYFYKLKKNGEKKRISQEEYNKKNKTRKNKKMIGGGLFEEDVHKQFEKNNIRFDGKKCLDIGSRDGLNCITLVILGAKEVIGIDIDDSRFNEMERNGKITLEKKNLLEMDNTEKFDIITCFLWNMNISQYNDIMIKIKSLLNEDGIVYIGIFDDLYKFSESGGSVPILLRRNFSNVRILDFESPFQWILEAKNKKLTEDTSDTSHSLMLLVNEYKQIDQQNKRIFERPDNSTQVNRRIRKQNP